MNLKKIVIGGILGGLGPFLLSGLWHLFVMKEVYYNPVAASVVRPEPILPLIGLSYLILGLILAYLYPFGYQGGSPVKEGIKFGLPIGLILGLSMEVGKFGIFQYSQLGAAVAESAWRIIEMSVAGVIIGLVYGKKDNREKPRN